MIGRAPSRRLVLAAFALAAGGLLLAGSGLAGPLERRLRGRKTVADRVEQHGRAARHRWRPFFEQAGLEYPPERVVIAAFKRERALDVFAPGDDGELVHLRRFAIRGASGVAGPKLRQGDLQVPEGRYRIESMNPNSRYHLSLRVGYPNDFDRARAREDGRTELGGDIMIHGSSVSIGCIAIGDEPIEDLFVLVAETGWGDAEVLISPVDFRAVEPPRARPGAPSWLPELYADLRPRIEALPPPS